jgi:REP element-mobilizing transposase RayT
MDPGWSLFTACGDPKFGLPGEIVLAIAGPRAQLGSAMSRPPRVDYPGAAHHVMNRGARREALFADDWVIHLFIGILSELPKRFRVKILAYAIMPNHYHLLLECPDGNLSKVMQYLGAQFTQRLNRRYQWDGPVFRGRFKSRLVEDPGYLAHLYSYIQSNPVRAGLANSVDTARWTSHAALVGLAPRPDWLYPDGILESFGTIGDFRTYVAESISSDAAPIGWDPEKLWVAPKVTKPGLARQMRRNPADLLEDVAVVAVASVAEVTKPQRGRHGNPLRSLAAWWLLTGGFLPNKEVGAVLGCTAGRVSQMRRKVNFATGRIASLRVALVGTGYLAPPT